MKDYLIILIILCMLYWYFNIRGKTKCITIVPECNSIDCIKENKV